MGFDLYLRVSTHLDESTSTSAETQEATCRNTASIKGIEIGEVVYDAGVSGGKAVAERQLEHLIRRCEAGESEGIIVYEVTRFGRDMAEGALAWKRMQACGARLISADGIDSDQPGSRLHFNMLTAIADDFLERNRSNWDRSKRSAIAKGKHIYPAPFGYRKDADARLVVEPDEAEIVRQLFRQRAGGIGFSELSRKFGLPRSSLRRICQNRAYLGETVVANRQRPKQPDIITDAHAPLVTVAEFESANAVEYAAPERKGWTKDLLLVGLVKCECGRRASAQSNGANNVSYGTPCKEHRATMTTHLLDRAVRWQLDKAIAEGEPHVAAVIEDDDGYELALVVVQEKKEALDEYRDDLTAQRTLGIADWGEGLKVRRAALDEARRALGERRPPSERAFRASEFTLEEASDADERAFIHRAIAEVILRPNGTDGPRVSLRWRGAEEFIPCPLVNPSAEPVAA